MTDYAHSYKLITMTFSILSQMTLLRLFSLNNFCHYGREPMHQLFGRNILLQMGKSIITTKLQGNLSGQFQRS